MKIKEDDNGKYLFETKQTRQKEVDKFPMFFAFNKEQFAEGLKKLNVKQEELISIFGGGFIRKSDKAKYIMMMDKQDNEHIRMMQDKNYVYNMFRYELANHEYCVREEDEDTLQSLNLYNRRC